MRTPLTTAAIRAGPSPLMLSAPANTRVAILVTLASPARVHLNPGKYATATVRIGTSAPAQDLAVVFSAATGTTSGNVQVNGAVGVQVLVNGPHAAATGCAAKATAQPTAPAEAGAVTAAPAREAGRGPGSSAHWRPADSSPQPRDASRGRRAPETDRGHALRRSSSQTSEQLRADRSQAGSSATIAVMWPLWLVPAREEAGASARRGDLRQLPTPSQPAVQPAGPALTCPAGGRPTRSQR